MTRKQARPVVDRDTDTVLLPPEPVEIQTESEPFNQVNLDLPQKDRPTVTVVAGPELGSVRALEAETPVVVGRGAEAHIRIDAPGVSRKHARFTYRSGVAYVEDLESKNGTFVESAPVTGPHPLCDGDRVQLGATSVLKFSLQDFVEQQAAVQVYQWTITDPLTRTYNRRHLEQRLQEEVAFALRHRKDLHVLMIDIDRFKDLNDTYGHQAGDIALTALADFLRRAMRAEDFLARYGGEEFSVIAREIDYEGAMAFAERLRSNIEKLPFPIDGESLHMTVSIGVGTLPQDADAIPPTSLLEHADEAMYRAKAAGRNRVSD